MLRDPRIYVDPDRFNPERFLKTKDHVPEMDPSAVGVFGFGRRCVKTPKEAENKPTETSFHLSQCPGQYLADMTTWHVVASILAAFDVSPASDNNGRPIDVRYAVNGVTEIIT
jgi:hypothetical protein